MRKVKAKTVLARIPNHALEATQSQFAEQEWAWSGSLKKFNETFTRFQIHTSLIQISLDFLKEEGLATSFQPFRIVHSRPVAQDAQ